MPCTGRGVGGLRRVRRRVEGGVWVVPYWRIWRSRSAFAARPLLPPSRAAAQQPAAHRGLMPARRPACGAGRGARCRGGSRWPRSCPSRAQAVRQPQRARRRAVRPDLTHGTLVDQGAEGQHRGDQQQPAGTQRTHGRAQQAAWVVATIQHIEHRHGAEGLACPKLIEAAHRAVASLGRQAAADLRGRLHDGHVLVTHAERRGECGRRLATTSADVQQRESGGRSISESRVGRSCLH
eukprot:scaffold97884_cov54-Phaeocystis_antarctica.AAC.2